MNRSRFRMAAFGLFAAGSLVAAVSFVAVNCAGPESRSPIQFRDPPAWTHKNVELDSVIGASLRGDAVILAGERDNQVRLVVADAESGAVRWSIAQNQVLPGGENLRVAAGYPNPFTGTGDAPVLAGDDDWSVVVSYSRFEADSGIGDDPAELGIAALSGADGSLEWARPLAEPIEDEEKRSTQQGVLPVAANADTVIASTAVGPRAFAVDAASGEKRWDREGVWPHSVTHGVVLGQDAAGDEPPPWESGGDNAGAVYGWDAESGKEKWKTGGAEKRLELEIATEAVAVASIPGERAGQVIDVETGAKLAELDAWVDNCVADTTDPDRLACSEDAIYVVTASDGEATIAENTVTDDRDGFRVTGMYDGRIFVEADEGNSTYKGGYVIDTDAEFLAGDVPGRPAAMSKEYALFLRGESEYGEGYAKAALYEVVKS